jgi:hypothetical protein
MTVWFCASDSGRYGATAPETMYCQKSSVWRWTDRVKKAASARAVVDLPAPGRTGEDDDL